MREFTVRRARRGTALALALGAGLLALCGLDADGARAMPRLDGLQIGSTAAGRVTVESELALPASRGRHRVLVAVEVHRREDRHGHVQGLLERRQRWIEAPRRASRRGVRFTLRRRASRLLIRKGVFDGRHDAADRHRRTTARELITFHVRGLRDGDGDGSAERIEVAGADGWQRGARGERATASGTGAVLAIRNRTAEPIAIATTPINCMYDHGEERSNLYLLNGTLVPGGTASAYVEGNANLGGLGINPLGAQATMVSWLKQYGAQLGVGATITALLSTAVAESLGPVTIFERSCAFSPSLFGVVATGRTSGQWALAIYEIGKGFPRNAILRADWSSGTGVRIGDTAGAGSSLTIPVG